MSETQTKENGVQGEITAPPKSDLEQLRTITEVVDEYGVSYDVAKDWLCGYGMYEPDRRLAGTSKLGQKLMRADPDDIGGIDE